MVKKKQNRRQFVLYSYISDLGNVMFNIVREDLLPFRTVNIVMVGPYSACASKLTEGWTSTEKAGVDADPVFYKIRS